MERQHQIKRTLAAPDSIDAIRRLLAEGTHASRSALVHATCKHFGFVDARGRAQTAGCVKALRELEHAGHFLLPAAGPRGRRPGQLGSARRLGVPVAMSPIEFMQRLAAPIQRPQLHPPITTLRLSIQAVGCPNWVGP